MGHEETEKSVEEIVDMIKKGDLSLAPKLYEQTKGMDAEVHRQKRAAWADAILNTKGRKEHGKNQ